jgi:hypothetical protein
MSRDTSLGVTRRCLDETDGKHEPDERNGDFHDEIRTVVVKKKKKNEGVASGGELGRVVVVDGRDG